MGCVHSQHSLQLSPKCGKRSKKCDISNGDCGSNGHFVEGGAKKKYSSCFSSSNCVADPDVFPVSDGPASGSELRVINGDEFATRTASDREQIDKDCRNYVAEDAECSSPTVSFALSANTSSDTAVVPSQQTSSSNSNNNNINSSNSNLNSNIVATHKLSKSTGVNNAHVAACTVTVCPPTPPKNTNLRNHNSALRQTSAFSLSDGSPNLDDNVLLHIMRCFPFGISPKNSPRSAVKAKSFSLKSQGGAGRVLLQTQRSTTIDNNILSTHLTAASSNSSEGSSSSLSLKSNVDPLTQPGSAAKKNLFSAKGKASDPMFIPQNDDRKDSKWFQHMMTKCKSISPKKESVISLQLQQQQLSFGGVGGGCIGYLATPRLSPSSSPSQQVAITPPRDGSVSPIHLQRHIESLKNLAGPAVSIGWLRERLKSWCQLSGHEGTIVPATDKTLWKKRAANDNYESNAYQKLMDDLLCGVVPRFLKEVEHKGEYFIEIEDLTQQFIDPAIMDVKMGTRTFLESEVTNPVKRKDLYQKMVAVDPNEPTEEEHAEQAVTKLRYMQFRERESSTATLGFRIEAIKVQQIPGQGLIKDFKKVKTRDQIIELLCQYIGSNKAVRQLLIDRLKVMRSKIEISPFFKAHEVIGSSLLMLHDKRHASAWMIDFAKTRPIDSDDEIDVDHRTPWRLGNHEDGYLFGLDNFIQVLEDTKLRDLPSLSCSSEATTEGIVCS